MLATPLQLERPVTRDVAEADIRWLFSQSDAALGLRSNFEAMVAGAPAERLPPPDLARWTTIVRPQSKHLPRWHEPTDRELQSADRVNRIWHALHAMPQVQAHVLVLAFSRVHALEPWWGRAAALVERTAAARAAYSPRSRRPMHVWLERLARKVRAGGADEDRQLYRAIQREAEATLNAACAAYLAARAGQRWPAKNRGNS